MSQNLSSTPEPLFRAPSAASPSILAMTKPVVAGALAGLAWNIFGVVKFVETLSNTPESLMQMGMTTAQAQVYTSYPTWMTVAFGVGVFGGLAGSALILFKSRFAVSVLAFSLVAYIALYVGDITEGVFAALGAPQVAVLTTVVVVAAALFVWSRALVRRGVLR